jgi:hypothetical protein
MVPVILILITLLPVFTKAQYLEPLDSVLSEIIHNNNVSLVLQTSMFCQYKEKDAVSLLPSIGYDLVTNRPLVNFSLNNFIALRQRRKELKYQVLQLENRAFSQLITDTITCRCYYQEIKELLEKYNGQLTLQKNATQLLQIKTAEHKKLQVTSEDILRTQLELERQQLSLSQARSEISAKALQISLLIKRSLRFSLPQ